MRCPCKGEQLAVIPEKKRRGGEARPSVRDARLERANAFGEARAVGGRFVFVVLVASRGAFGRSVDLGKKGGLHLREGARVLVLLFGAVGLKCLWHMAFCHRAVRSEEHTSELQ